MGLNLRVSIIVPSYQQAEFLPRTLDSLVLQQGVPLEIIIQDGGSTDDSVKTIQEYAQKYPNLIRWESKKDGGQSAGINMGLKKATGDIIGYLNSDDLLYPDALKNVTHYFDQHSEAMLVYGIGDHIDEEGAYLGVYPTEKWSYPHLLETCFICQPACFWRREVMERHGFFDESLHYSMDYEYWLRVGQKEKFHYLPLKLAASRCHIQAKRFEAEAAVRAEAVQVVFRYNRGKASLSWLAGLAKVRAAKWLNSVCPTCGVFGFCLSYWKNLFALLPKMNTPSLLLLLQKLIPPLKSVFGRKKDPFFYLK
ncbi:MAG: glycosyltransferase family 2 protein [Verrucomicrobiota bacterium]